MLAALLDVSVVDDHAQEEDDEDAKPLTITEMRSQAMRSFQTPEFRAMREASKDAVHVLTAGSAVHDE